MRVGIFHREPVAAADCCLALWKVLGSECSIRILTAEDITYRRIRSLQIVAFPGGIGDAGLWSQIFSKRPDEVSRYVERGGRYLGVCMGAYWAADFGLLGNASVRRYVTVGEIKRSFPTTARVVWNGQPERMYFWDGPTFEGGFDRVIATYANGFPMAVIHGRVGLIGCHPESQTDWYAPRHLKRQWHGGAHHELLRQFVRELAKT